MCAAGSAVSSQTTYDKVVDIPKESSLYSDGASRDHCHKTSDFEAWFGHAEQRWQCRWKLKDGQ